MEKKYCTAVVLAGGSGKRMGTKVHKQYLMLKGYPVLYYSLKAFQDSAWIDEIVLVSGAGEEEYCQKEIVEKYDFSKVCKIVAGGAERYNSVWNGLQQITYSFLSLSKLQVRYSIQIPSRTSSGKVFIISRRSDHCRIICTVNR